MFPVVPFLVTIPTSASERQSAAPEASRADLGTGQRPSAGGRPPEQEVARASRAGPLRNAFPRFDFGWSGGFVTCSIRWPDLVSLLTEPGK
jgi:hypothetical protein